MEIILTRDPRTTSHRVLDRVAQDHTLNLTSILPPKSQDNIVANNRYIEATITRTKKINCAQSDSHPMPAFHERRIRLIRSTPVKVPTWPRLGWLWLSASTILLAVSVHSSPIMNNLGNNENVTVCKEILELMKTVPKWMDPCGLNIEMDSQQDTQDPLTVEKIAESVALAAKTAWEYGSNFHLPYVNNIFHASTAHFHNVQYHWLPGWDEIPKMLGQNLPEDYLEKRDLDTELIKTYEIMQKYAMCLEQIVWDQKLLGLSYYIQFMKIEAMCRNLLCELHDALMQRGITLLSNVDRSLMPIEYRGEQMRHNATFRDLRDWLFFRDYMNGLEYVKQVFDYIAEKAERHVPSCCELPRDEDLPQTVNM